MDWWSLVHTRIYRDHLKSWLRVYKASNEGYPKVLEDFAITEKAPTRAFSWLKAPTSAFSSVWAISMIVKSSRRLVGSSSDTTRTRQNQGDPTLCSAWQFPANWLLLRPILHEACHTLLRYPSPHCNINVWRLSPCIFCIISTHFETFTESVLFS